MPTSEQGVLTYEAALRAAEEAIAEHGEGFVYNPLGGGVCAYISTTDPRMAGLSRRKSVPFAVGSAVTGCLVGEILRRTGLLTDNIATESSGIATLIMLGEVRIEDRRVQYFLANAQSFQDQGTSWGKAVANAKRAAEKEGD